MGQITNCLLSLGIDYNDNIQIITKTCGELLKADSAFYSRLDNEFLYFIGKWHAPDNFSCSDLAAGHICEDIIRNGANRPLVIRDLDNTIYASTDSYVTAYNLKTYIGHPVCFAGKNHGSLCVVYTRDYDPPESDLSVITIITSALAQEEERHHAEIKIHQRKQDYQTILDHAQEAVLVLQDEKIRYVNLNVLRISGYSVDEIFNHNFLDFIHPADRDEAYACNKNQISGNNVLSEFEIRIIAISKETVLIRINIIPTRWEEKSAVLLFFIDITSQRAYEEALQDSEEKSGTSLQHPLMHSS